MNGFIKVSNSIFNYELKPKSLFIFVYLTSKANSMHSAAVTYLNISEACNMSIKTVQTAIKVLESKKLIKKQNRYNTRGYIANRYYIKNLMLDDNKWFKVERAVFNTQIKAHNFMVFCFIRKSMSAKHNEAFPSLTAICDGTGISRSRVSQAVTYLRNYTFVNRVKRQYKRTCAYRHNRYLHFKCNVKNGKRKARTIKCKANLLNNYIIHPNFQKVKSFLLEKNVIVFSRVVRHLPNTI